MKGFGFKLKKMEKQVIKFVLSDSNEGGYYVKFPIANENVKKDLRNLKRLVLEGIDKASLLGENQIVKYGNAVFTLYPSKLFPGDEKLAIKEFKINEW